MYIYIIGLLVIAAGVGYWWNDIWNHPDFSLILLLIILCAVSWPILAAVAIVMVPLAAVAAFVYWIRNRK